MDTFADQNITPEQALHDSMDCLRMAQKILGDLGHESVAALMKEQAEKNLRILTGTA
jgi:hypothetical protein